jgi:hypothetical protein
MINFIIGIFAGAFLGVTTMALLNMAKDTEPPKQEKHEPAKLWTVGNICKWHERIYEIRFFCQGKDGQTLACIFMDGSTLGISVPIEELEEVEE